MGMHFNHQQVKKKYRILCIFTLKNEYSPPKLRCHFNYFIQKIMRFVLSLTTFLFLIPGSLFSQTSLFKGTVKDEQTLKPIPDVNIRVAGTTQGTATDNTGRFSLILYKIPSTLIFSCLGYEDEYYKISAVPVIPVEFLLSLKSYTLKEVNISAKNYTFLFKDRDYSVLDYELMDGNVLLLIFRMLLKQSELVLLDRTGDTLAVSNLPEVPPSRLFKDFLANIHYISKSDYAYQCYYNRESKNIDFIYKTTVDSIQKFIKPFLFSMAGRLYFQEKIANGFGTAIGFYEKGTGKKYIRQVINNKKLTEYIDDQKFYNRWNASTGIYNVLDSDDIESDRAFDFSVSRAEGGAYGKNEARAHAFEYFNMIYPVIKIRDNTMAFFNFGNDVIELMNKDGKIIKTVPISFHKESVSNSDTSAPIRLSESGWRWGTMIMVDGFNNHVYTTFFKSGMIRIHRIDPETGKLSKGTMLPLPFPEKIEIYDGEAYFLNKGVNENWKLVKCSL
jgi:hypothetical protein